MMLKARGHDRSHSQQLLEVLLLLQLVLLPAVLLIKLSSLTQPVNTKDVCATYIYSSRMRDSEWRRIHGIHKQEFYYK